MEVNFNRMKEQLLVEIEDILRNDDSKNQRQNLKELASSARVMCDTYHLIDRAQGRELRDIVQAAIERARQQNK